MIGCFECLHIWGVTAYFTEGLLGVRRTMRIKQILN